MREHRVAPVLVLQELMLNLTHKVMEKKRISFTRKELKKVFFLMRLAFYVVIWSLSDLSAGNLPSANTTNERAPELWVIKGTVIDSVTKEPMPGVSVRLKGTQIGTATAVDGKFELKIPKSKEMIIVVSFIGMKTKEIKITKPETTLKILLQEDVARIKDVVVTGYATVRREAYTGSATVMTARKIEERPVASFQDVLRGNSPGTLVTSTGQPGVSGTIRLRGISSMNASNAPLYVVDGIVWDAANMSGSAEFPTNPLNTLNPSDIASMTVLKDAASASLYGSRGANGVIVITTKQGQIGKRPQYTVDMQFGFSKIFEASKPELVNGKEFTELWLEGEMHRMVYAACSKDDDFFAIIKDLYKDKEGYKFDGKNYNEWYADAKTEFCDVFKIKKGADSDEYYTDLFGADADKMPDVNWYDEVTRTAPFQKINVSARGGSRVGKFYASLEYFNQQGVLKSSELKRYSLRMNLTSDDPDNFFNWGLNTQLTYSAQSGPRRDALGYAMLHYTALSLAPVVPVYLEDGSFNFNFPKNVNSNMNPLAVAKYNSYDRPQTKVLTSGFLQFNLTKWLKIKSTFGLDYLHARRRQYYDKDFGDGAKSDGYLYERDARRRKISNTNLAYLEKTFNEVHEVLIYGGIEWEDMKSEYIRAEATKFLSDDFPYLSAAAVPDEVAGDGDRYSMLSWLLKGDYSYDNKYFFSASFRSDRSSRFHKDYRVGNFWSVSGAWRIKEESFMQGLDWLNNLKVKASYGINGTLPSSYYSWRSRYSFGYNYNGHLGLKPTAIASKDLSWEENKIFNIGLEMGFFNRIDLSVEYYNRRTENLLQDLPISYVTGHKERLVNSSAGLKNRGWEIELHASIVQERQINWDFNINIATLRNEFFGLTNDDIGTQIKRNGESYYSWYLREWAGIDPQTGEQQWYKKDDQGNKVITKDYDEADRDIRGTALPKVNGGFSSTVSYRGLELSFLFTYAMGHKVLDYTGRTATKNDGARDIRAIEKDQLDRWTPDNPTGKNPLRINSKKWSRWTSTRYLYKGDYLKLKNIKLQYDFPKSWMDKLTLRSAKVFVQAENLFALSKLKGYDPEMTLNGYRNPDDYPSAMTFTAGLQINF